MKYSNISGPRKLVDIRGVDLLKSLDRVHSTCLSIKPFQGFEFSGKRYTGSFSQSPAAPFHRICTFDRCT